MITIVIFILKIIEKNTIYDSGANNAFGNTVIFEDYNSNSLWFSRDGNDDSVTFRNWYRDSSYQNFKIMTADHKYILGSQLQQLIHAMAGFNSGSQSGGMVIPSQMDEFINLHNPYLFWSNSYE